MGAAEVIPFLHGATLVCIDHDNMGAATALFIERTKSRSAVLGQTNDLLQHATLSSLKADDTNGESREFPAHYYSPATVVGVLPVFRGSTPARGCNDSSARTTKDSLTGHVLLVPVS
jgi:hypothetical protein